MGFGIESDSENEYEKIREKILDETKRVFSLGKEDMLDIVELELRNVADRLKERARFAT